jgi:capsular exopolysaccharide synthesis family protein
MGDQKTRMARRRERENNSMETVVFRNIKEFSNAKKEALRALKTNIQFCGDDVKVIMFTSSFPNEGKSTVTFDLAMSLTESGKNVLLIDSDMRASVLVGQLRAKTEGGKKIVGLSHYLTGQKKLDEILYTTKIPNMSIIFAGPMVPNPTEILEKRYFEQMIDYSREKFDYVLIDCAPLGAVIDAAVVAKHCDGAVLVVAQGVAGTRAILNSKKQLETAGVRILGAVLNKVKTEKRRYGRYYGRYYGNYYGEYYSNAYEDEIITKKGKVKKLVEDMEDNVEGIMTGTEAGE